METLDYFWKKKKESRRKETHDVAKAEETMPDHCTFPVHHLMCKQLEELVDGIAKILPDIEASRSHCRSGIEALCLLSRAVEKTKQLLQSCIESSKLYLAITGDAIVLRCQKSKQLLEQSLCQIQTMAPVTLSAEISQIVDDLKATTFVLDSSEEEAGKALLELLHRDTSASELFENREKRAFQLAASRLHITSRKAIVLEIRAIKKLLTKVGEKDRNKKRILNYFLCLLKKYGTLTAGEQRDGRNAQDDGLARVGNSLVNSRSAEVESRLSVGLDEAQTDMFCRNELPEKLRCPISGRLMYDPVLIASGFTFERMWIQKWFDEGNDTCPITNMKLADFSLTPNKVVKDQISEWCSKIGVSITDPNRKAFHSLDVSSTSIASFGSSMNDRHLPLDARNVSFGSSDYNSDSHIKVTDPNKQRDVQSLITKEQRGERKAQDYGFETYVSRSLALNFRAECLLELNLCCSKDAQLQRGTQNLVNLKLIDLSNSKFHRMPDLSGAYGLQSLNLQGCINLVEVSSIRYLTKLEYLNLKGCTSLRCLPCMIKLKFLTTLNLSDCVNLRSLPSSVGCLSSLVMLDLRNCTSIQNLPISTSQQRLNISGCLKLMKHMSVEGSEGMPIELQQNQIVHPSLHNTEDGVYCKEQQPEYSSVASASKSFTRRTEIEVFAQAEVSSLNQPKLREALEEFMNMSVEDLCQADAFDDVERIANQLIQENSNLFERENLEDLLYCLEELREGIHHTLGSMNEAQAYITLLQVRSAVLGGSLAKAVEQYSLLDAKFASLSKEEEQLEAEIQCLIAKKKEELLDEKNSTICFKEIPYEENDVSFRLNGRTEKAANSSNRLLYSWSAEEESCLSGDQDEAQIDTSSRSTIPEKLKCPISGRLMYDPVLIASGFTFERMWIQKWFEEANDTCPITNMKLADFSLTPNKVVKDQISEWCSKIGVSITDPNRKAFHSLNVSSTSIASNVFPGSPNDSSDSSTNDTEGSYLTSMWTTESSGTSQTNVKEDLELLSRLAELPWESQCMVVEDVKCQLQYDDKVCQSMSSVIFIGPLITFLKDAQDNHDLRALKAGSELLLALLSENRKEIECLNEDALSVMTSFLESEITEEALGILEILSGYPYCISKFSESGALVPLLKFLESPSKKFQEPVIKILHNVSSNNEICSQIVSLGCIPKLVPFISDGKLARFSIVLVKNLCDTKEARVSVAETNGCIASIAKLLENESHEEQEHAVDVLLSLCSVRVEYCRLALDEGIIPSLIYISNNGSEKGKVRALELLRQLRDVDYEDGQGSLGSDLDPDREATQFTQKNRSSSKARGFFKRNFALFHNLARHKEG